jgi:hypothetical protein
MAARKSCTHLTWAEAKEKSGLGATHKKKDYNKQQQPQALKLLAKTFDTDENRKLAKQQYKLEQKLAVVAAKLERDRNLQRALAQGTVRPFDMAQEQLTAEMNELRSKHSDDSQDMILASDNDTAIQQQIENDESLPQQDDDTNTIIECKQLQLDELLALEAMMEDGDLVLTTGVAALRAKVARLEAGDDSMRVAIALHPPIELYMKLSIDDNRTATATTPIHDVSAESTSSSSSMMRLNCSVLLCIRFPSLYLCSTDDSTAGSTVPHTAPHWDFKRVFVTDMAATCRADKPLESVAWLDTNALQTTMTESAAHVLPYPCVYETAVTWLSEHIFDYVTMRPHVLATASKLLAE